jgi:hypothetical protein
LSVVTANLGLGLLRSLAVSASTTTTMMITPAASFRFETQWLLDLVPLSLQCCRVGRGHYQILDFYMPSRALYDDQLVFQEHDIESIMIWAAKHLRT